MVRYLLSHRGYVVRPDLVRVFFGRQDVVLPQGGVEDSVQLICGPECVEHFLRVLGSRDGFGEIVEGNDSVTAFAKDLRENMIGHRVLLYVEMQVGKTPDKKFRILQHVDDLGEDTSITDEDLENGRARAAKDMKR